MVLGICDAPAFSAYRGCFPELAAIIDRQEQVPRELDVAQTAIQVISSSRVAGVLQQCHERCTRLAVLLYFTFLSLVNEWFLAIVLLLLDGACLVFCVLVLTVISVNSIFCDPPHPSVSYSTGLMLNITINFLNCFCPFLCMSRA